MTTTEEPSGGSWDATQWHEVKKGETLWKIAEQYYGDGSLHTQYRPRCAPGPARRPCGT